MDHVSRRSLAVIEDDPSFWTKTAFIQIGYGLWINLTVIGIGLTFGWPAVSIPQLMEKDSKMNMTLKDQAWIASVLTLFSPIGCIISGFLMDKYGRRYLLIFSEIPVGIGWFYTGFATTPLHIVVGRIITGIGIGFLFSAPRAYITEITLPNMRGVVGAFPNIAVAIGIMIQAALGTFFKWYILCFISGIYSFSLFLIYLMLPETPYYILMKSDVVEAKKALKKFRSKNFNIAKEIEELKDFKQTNDIRRLTFKQQLSELLKTSSCKPFGLGLTYILIMQASGVNVITMWGVEMLENSQTSIDAHTGNFIMASTRVFFGIITSILLYKTGRRVLALTSATGVGCVCIALSVYLSVYNKEAIYPLILYVAYMAFATLGYYSLPMLILFELLPLQVRGILSGAVLAIVNLLMFSMNQCYPYMRDYLGLHVTMFIFGMISLLGALLLYFILPETKNLTLQEIEEYFNATRSTLISSRQYMKNQSLSSSSIDLTRSSSYERKKKRNMRSLKKSLEHDTRQVKDEEYDKLKTLYENKSKFERKGSKEDNRRPSSGRKGVVFKESNEPSTSEKNKE